MRRTGGQATIGAMQRRAFMKAALAAPALPVLGSPRSVTVRRSAGPPVLPLDVDVQEATLTLLRPERCVVLELSDATDELRPVAGSAGEFSSTIARRAIEEGRAVVVSEDDAAGDVSESLILAGVRSSLATPIFVRGRVAACFYLEHRGVSGLFGPDEERIADFIATVGGSALENAEGFAEIRDLFAPSLRAMVSADAALRTRFAQRQRTT